MILNLPRLTWQASITCIENEVAESMDFDDLISEFAETEPWMCFGCCGCVSLDCVSSSLQEIWIFPFLWWAVTQISVHSPFEKGSGNSLFYVSVALQALPPPKMIGGGYEILDTGLGTGWWVMIFLSSSLPSLAPLFLITFDVKGQTHLCWLPVFLAVRNQRIY